MLSNNVLSTGLSLDLVVTLNEQQLQDPTNLILAHDVGLAHYALLKNRDVPDNPQEHWQRVLANWGLILESESYWQTWSANRAPIYGVNISDEHLANVRQALNEQLIRDITAANSPFFNSKPLEVAFYLEKKAIALLKTINGRSGAFSCGPLLAAQLGITFDDLFHKLGSGSMDATTLVEIILNFCQDKASTQPIPDAVVRRMLSWCFSQLGHIFLALELGDPVYALEVFRDCRCEYCNATGEHLESICHEDCPQFASLNPAFAKMSAGRKHYFTYRIALGAAAYVTVAHQSLRQESVDFVLLQTTLTKAFELASIIDLGDSLRQKLTDLMLRWADELMRDGRLDDAIQVAEQTRQFATTDHWCSRLAGLLNARGNQHFKNERWREAVADFRYGYELYPLLTALRPNLAIALFQYSNAIYNAGHTAKAPEYLREAITLAEAEYWSIKDDPDKTGEYTSWKLHLVEWKQRLYEWGAGEKPDLESIFGAEPAPTIETTLPLAPALQPLILTDVQRANLYLVDKYGDINLAAFDESGCTVLEIAQQQAAALNEILITPTAILMALALYSGGETQRLLHLQGIAPVILQYQSQAIAHNGYDKLRSRPATVLSQYDMESRVFSILELARQVAEFDQHLIGELHLLGALLIHGSGNALLESAGVNLGKMWQQIGLP